LNGWVGSPTWARPSGQRLRDSLRERYLLSNLRKFRGALQEQLAGLYMQLGRFADLYAMRGDAYMKAGRRAEALADFRRVKSDVWSGGEPSLPRHVYFDENGRRYLDVPQP
jgi:hypothetical protein